MGVLSLTPSKGYHALDSKGLYNWTLGTCILDASTLNTWTVIDWTIEPGKLFPFSVICISFLLLFNVRFLNISNGL